MAKNEKQKLKPLYLKQILEEYTDENHGLTMERLLGLLEQKGIKAERKSIYDDIFVLAEDGTRKNRNDKEILYRRFTKRSGGPSCEPEQNVKSQNCIYP